MVRGSSNSIVLGPFGLSAHGKAHIFPGMTDRYTHLDNASPVGFLAQIRTWSVEFQCYLIAQAFPFFYRLKIRGYDKVPGDSACIFVCNHGSHFDGFLLYAAIMRSDTRPVVPVVWYRLLEFTMLGPILGHILAIPVNNDASATASRVKGLRSMIRHLREGRHLWIQPEGHRCDELGKFHPGAALISLKTGAPLVPISLRGVQPLYKNLGDFPRLWGRVEMIFHPPLYPVDVEGNTDEEKAIQLMAKARAAVASALDYPVGAA